MGIRNIEKEKPGIWLFKMFLAWFTFIVIVSFCGKQCKDIDIEDENRIHRKELDCKIIKNKFILRDYPYFAYTDGTTESVSRNDYGVYNVGDTCCWNHIINNY